MQDHNPNSERLTLLAGNSDCLGFMVCPEVPRAEFLRVIYCPITRRQRSKNKCDDVHLAPQKGGRESKASVEILAMRAYSKK